MKKFAKLLVLVLAAMMILSVAAFAWEQYVKTTYYENTCTTCGMTALVTEWSNTVTGMADAVCCKSVRWYESKKCQICGMTDLYVVRQDDYYHLFDDSDGDGIYKCVHCNYTHE